jgi:two-component system sensor histidine kinase MtrB
MELVVGGRVASDALAIYRIVDLTPLEAELMTVGRTLAVASALPVVSALLIGWFLAGRLLHPIRSARDGALLVRDGDLTTRLRVRGDDELAELLRSFNDMTASLEHSVA